MTRTHDSINRAESISTIIVNVGTIISWLFTLFTAFVLTSQPKPISLPGVLELSAGYKLLFLMSVLLGFVQVLRRGWENQKRKGKDIEGSFGSYIYASVIKLRRPLVLIGFLIILGIIAALISTEIVGLGVALIFIGFVVGASFLSLNGPESTKRLYDDEYRKRWLKRIKNRLYQNGCTLTLDFQDLPASYDEINWALILYFDVYEFEQDLILAEKFVERNYHTYRICEIRFEHIPSRLPKVASKDK